MDIHPKIERILNEYHEFCLGIIDKIPASSSEKEQLAEQVQNNYEVLRKVFVNKQTVAEYLKEQRMNSDEMA